MSIRRHRQTAGVEIMTAGGKRSLLWVPCDRPFAMGDREFRAKAQQIMDYWQRTGQAPAHQVTEL